ncbi:MAG TPA: sigma-70 family RNA polymerase sigma factor [Planctomycetota bacterium]|nr:sigma-70 family RNA polymerase sigma factor [Planctomycetota bacterium]
MTAIACRMPLPVDSAAAGADAAPHDAAPFSAATLEREYGRLVHGVLVAHAPLDAVDDLAQDVLLAALKHAPSLRDPAALGPWLVVAARRRAVDALRRRRAISALPDDVVDGRAAGRAAAGVEAREALDALRALPEAYRETLALRLVEGLSGPEIAARTGLTPGSVRVNLHRGLALLRAKLQGGARER